jgi:hypothetical protein
MAAFEEEQIDQGNVRLYTYSVSVRKRLLVWQAVKVVKARCSEPEVTR